MSEAEPREPNPLVLHQELREAYLRMFGYTYKKGPYENSSGYIERRIPEPQPEQDIVNRILNPYQPEHPLSPIRRLIKLSLLSDPLKASIVRAISLSGRNRNSPDEHIMYNLLGFNEDEPLAFEERYIQDLSRKLLQHFSFFALFTRSIMESIGHPPKRQTAAAELYSLARNAYIEKYDEEP